METGFIQAISSKGIYRGATGLALLLGLTLSMRPHAARGEWDGRIDRVAGQDRFVLWSAGPCKGSKYDAEYLDNTRAIFSYPDGRIEANPDSSRLLFGYEWQKSCYQIFDPRQASRRFFVMPHTIGGEAVSTGPSSIIFYNAQVSAGIGNVTVSARSLEWGEGDDPYVVQEKIILKEVPDKGLEFNSVSALYDPAQDLVHLALVNRGYEMSLYQPAGVYYCQHNLSNGAVSDLSLLGNSNAAQLVMGPGGPVLVYVENTNAKRYENAQEYYNERWKEIVAEYQWEKKVPPPEGPDLLVIRELKEGQWSPRRALTTTQANQIDVIAVGPETYILGLERDPKTKTVSSISLTRVDAGGKVKSAPLPLDQLAGNVYQPRMMMDSGNLSIYYGLDENGDPIKKVFKAAALEAMLKPSQP